MSRIYKRPESPNWQYTDSGKPRRIQKSTGTPNRRIAQLIQAKWDEERILQKHGIKLKNIIMGKLHDEYLLLIESRKSYSWFIRIRVGLSHFYNTYRNYNISAISVKDINDYISDRMSQGRANKTVRDEISIIKSMFNYAIENEYLFKNPCDKAMLPVKKTVQPRKALSADIVKKVIELAWHEDDRLFWKLLYYTGLRVADAGTLQKHNLVDNTIELTQIKTAEPVRIPLHSNLVPYKNKLINLMPTLHHRNRSRVRFQKILEENYGIHSDLHSLRHSFNTHLRDLGLGYEDRRVLLGHKAASRVTADYTHTNPELLKSYIDKL